MSKETYYRSLIQRKNVFKNFLLDFFFMINSYPKLLIEVFTRKNFGTRYFKLSSVITGFIIFAAIPLLPLLTYDFLDEETPYSLKPFYSWFTFLIVFLAFSIIRLSEIKRKRAMFDFKEYSLNDGTINKVFFKIKLPGIKTDIRLVEIFFEPLPFFIAGIVLWFLGEKLGILLTCVSICYSLGYLGAYEQGDNFILDKIDEIISNEELEKVFVDDAEPEDARGFKTRGGKPGDKRLRRELMPMMTKAEEVFVAT